MSQEIVIQVLTQGGDEHEIETPVDIMVSELIRELTTALQLPPTYAEGNLISWCLDNRTTARRLSPNNKLSQEGVADGHVLVLSRQVTAGCFPESTKILRSTGEYVKIGSIAPGDDILSFHADRHHYVSTKVSLCIDQSEGNLYANLFGNDYT